ncbi:uncharacterized protein LOC117654441 [Thrips palmi]|uniref:Uncharacterized protein LOC117654441 n=1 Tax=Thrips palmi TaxID=161013 RepID=A0A6P9AF52_THRPL|nr:uncharacterized protein LOC117654441 [Thrips palmi]
MRTSLVVAVSAALVALCALALPVRAKAALDAKGAAEQCVCQLSDPRRPLQLVRGADQVSRCEKGEYCNCAAKTVAICDFSFMEETFRFNEEEQMCDFRVDCQAFFDRTTVSPATAEPTPPTLPPLPTEPEVTTAAAPTSPPEPCRCSDASRALQLIRGADQESRCQTGDYCDCRAKTVQHCDDFEALGERMRFNEQDQECDLTFDCQAFFRGPTERPSTATPRTAAPTAAPLSLSLWSYF